MNLNQLVASLNAYPLWVELDDQATQEQFDKVTALSRLYQQADADVRRSVTAALDRPAKNIMFDYTRSKANEALRTRTRTALLDGIIPVVMAGGDPGTVTVGFLLTILLDAAVKSGVNTSDLFDSAARVCPDEDRAQKIREFPKLPKHLTSLQRYGVREAITPKGVVYQDVTERPLTWWQRLRGRKQIRRAEVIKMMRESEQHYDRD